MATRTHLKMTEETSELRFGEFNATRILNPTYCESDKGRQGLVFIPENDHVTTYAPFGSFRDLQKLYPQEAIIVDSNGEKVKLTDLGATCFISNKLAFSGNGKVIKLITVRKTIEA